MIPGELIEPATTSWRDSEGGTVALKVGRVTNKPTIPGEPYDMAGGEATILCRGRME